MNANPWAALIIGGIGGRKGIMVYPQDQWLPFNLPPSTMWKERIPSQQIASRSPKTAVTACRIFPLPSSTYSNIETYASLTSKHTTTSTISSSFFRTRINNISYLEASHFFDSVWGPQWNGGNPGQTPSLISVIEKALKYVQCTKTQERRSQTGLRTAGHRQ